MIGRDFHKSYYGLTIAVLASGPSMTEEDAIIASEKWTAIAVNKTYELVPYWNLDFIYSNDEDWYASSEAFNRRPFTITALGYSGKPLADELIKQNKFDIVLPYKDKPHISVDPDYLSWGGNSGYAAINFAYWLGAKRIIMLGFDQSWDGDKPRWHGRHKEGLQNQKPGFHRWAVYFNQAAKDYAALGVEVINCSRRTTLECFPRMNLEDVV